jgi:flagellar hook-associated protein 3 FlgL
MTVSTISTFAAFQSTLSDVSKVENDLNNEQAALSSGNASPDFAGMASTTEQDLSLNASIARGNQYLSNNQVTTVRLNTADTALGQIITIGNQLQSLISTYGANTSAAFSTQLQATWQQLAGQLNTQIDGQYLFSGTATTTPAVDPNSFPTTQSPGVPDASYYQGSSDNITVRISDNQTITSGVTGDSKGFQEIIAGLAMAKRAGGNGSATDMQTAETLVQQGVRDVTSLQATVGANESAVNTADTFHNNQKLYWQGIVQSIQNTDIVSVSTQVAVNQGILQAAFQTFAKITSLRLGDFLK